jgi:hypothetical protein
MYPIGWKVAFASAAGIKRLFPVITASNPFFTTSGVKNSFPVVSSSNPFFITTGVKTTFPVTISNNSFFTTSGLKISFPVVLGDDIPKELKLRFGDFEVAPDYSSITAIDATGEETATNPDGYNPEADPINIFRAKRSEVDLYLAYKVWTSPTTLPETVIAPAGDPTNVDWEYVLPVDTYGVYRMYMIAAPSGTPYQDVENLGDGVFDTAYYKLGWYATTAAVITDPDVLNCLNNKRYEFLTSVMCGDCDPKYLEIYGWFVGALNALDLGTTAGDIEAMELIDKIKAECSEADCPCNCNC